MTSLAQFLLLIVVSTLTFLITLVTIQVLHILQDIRQSIQRFNQILANTSTISQSVAKPITAVNEFFSEVKNLVNETQDELIDSTPDRPLKNKHRYFHRSGLPLRPAN